MSSASNLSRRHARGNMAPTTPIQGRATDEQIKAIDIAASIEGFKRGPWLVHVAYERAQRLVREHAERVVKGQAA